MEKVGAKENWKNRWLKAYEKQDVNKIFDKH
jgi:hypothetical protein